MVRPACCPFAGTRNCCGPIDEPYHQASQLAALPRAKRPNFLDKPELFGVRTFTNEKPARVYIHPTRPNDAAHAIAGPALPGSLKSGITSKAIEPRSRFPQ